jgi:hypothetical protein
MAITGSGGFLGGVSLELFITKSTLTVARTRVHLGVPGVMRDRVQTIGTGKTKNE